MIKTIAEAAEHLSAYLLIDEIPDGDSSPEFRVSMLRNFQIKPLVAKLISLVADGQLTARTSTGTSCTSEVEPTESTLIDVAEAKAALDADAPFGKLFEDDRAALPGADSPISLSERIENSESVWPTNAEFAEYVSNGAFINWPYWVGKMPILTPQQAARLMAGLDPDIFESLDAQPNRNDATQRCTHAKYIERLAIAEQITNLPPSEWLQWADKREFEVHDAFRDAVLLFDGTGGQAKAAVQIYSWPGIAAEQEKARRNAGRYQIGEAAEQLELHAGERADTMIDKLSKAAFEGNLPVHLPGEKARHAYPQNGMVRSNVSTLPGGISYFAGTDWRQHVRDFYEEAYWDDLNAWLAENEPRIDWKFPAPPRSVDSERKDDVPGPTDSKTQAPALAVLVHSIHERRDILDPALDKAIGIAGSHDTAAVFLALRSLALEEEQPFTGSLEKDALCYTDSNNNPKLLSKDALSKRLKRRGTKRH